MLENAKACDGLPTFIIIFTGNSGNLPVFVIVCSKRNKPSYTYPVSPSAQETVTLEPSRISAVALPQPTTAGIPISRATIAAWQVRPPRLVTIAEARFIIGSQSGSVMSVTSTSLDWISCIWSMSIIKRAVP